VCARKQDLPLSQLRVIEPGDMWRLRGGGSGLVSCESFFPWLVAFLFVDSEMALLIAGNGTPWVPFGSPDLPSSG
jgi:hypothetical protein